MTGLWPWLCGGLAVAALAAAAMALAALRRARRQFADVGDCVLTCSHDMRGILSPALLTADRLTGHADPAIRQQAEAVAQAIEQATKRWQPAVALARHAVRKPRRAS